jgi:hypothetical protein
MTDREMIDQWLVVGLERGEAARFSGDATLRADCAVGFVYVDSMCGMTFNVEAWCNTDGESLLAVSRPSDMKQRIMLRYDTFAGKAKRMLTHTERAALVFPAIPDWLSLYYQGDETMRVLRALPLLDPVRAPGYPDDIKCFLFDRNGSKDGESIWAKVIGQGGDGCFLCRLLNEPYQDFGVHEGEMVSVALAEQEDGLVAVCLGKPTGQEYE